MHDCRQRMWKLPVEGNISDSNHDKLELAVQMIDRIGVLTDPKALSINILGMGQGRGWQRRNI